MLTVCSGREGVRPSAVQLARGRALGGAESACGLCCRVGRRHRLDGRDHAIGRRAHSRRDCMVSARSQKVTRPARASSARGEKDQSDEVGEMRTRTGFHTAPRTLANPHRARRRRRRNRLKARRQLWWPGRTRRRRRAAPPWRWRRWQPGAASPCASAHAAAARRRRRRRGVRGAERPSAKGSFR